MTLRARFIAFDDALAARGVPPLTPWWREAIGAWLDAYESGGVLELWACVGRGAAKSTALYKLALFFTLFGTFVIPPGERHYAIVLSRLKEEAGKGLAIIARWLELLGVEHNPTGDEIEIDVDGTLRGIRVVAASVAAATGWRAYFVAKDERSKWPQDSDAQERDAEEIDTSAAAMTATHAEDAPVLAFGSAWGTFGAFYDAIIGGSNVRRMVLGPTSTWIAAPHITEASLRRLEPNERKFQREYKCVFQPGNLSVFDVETMDACFAARAFPSWAVHGQPIVVIDASSGKSDAWVWGFVHWVLPIASKYRMVKRYIGGGQWGWETALDRTGNPIPLKPEDVFPPTLVVDGIKSVTGRFWEQVQADEIVDAVVADANQRGAELVVADQREAFSLTSMFNSRGKRFHAFDWTNPIKVEAIEILRRLMVQGTLALPRERVSPTSGETRPHQRLRSEMLQFEERILPSGAIGFGARGKRHDDHVAILLTAAMAVRGIDEIRNGRTIRHPLVPMTPIYQPRTPRRVAPGFVA